MKKHPLKIEYTEDDGATDYYTYFSKGEQDAKAFCEKLKLALLSLAMLLYHIPA